MFHVKHRTFREHGNAPTSNHFTNSGSTFGLITKDGLLRWQIFSTKEWDVSRETSLFLLATLQQVILFLNVSRETMSLL